VKLYDGRNHVQSTGGHSCNWESDFFAQVEFAPRLWYPSLEPEAPGQPVFRMWADVTIEHDSSPPAAPALSGNCWRSGIFNQRRGFRF
jgi:hypothetical protein